MAFVQPTATVHNGTDTPLRVHLLDTAERLRAATALLSVKESIAVDIEGVNLGRDGCIATIQLCGPEGTDVFIVDVVRLGAAVAFSSDAGLRALLENESVVKIFYDVRADANALFHLHEVTLQATAVTDLQLAVVCRDLLRSAVPSNLEGLAKVFRLAPESVLNNNTRVRMDQVKVHAQAMFAPEKGGSYEVWLQRPLHPLLLEYATDCVFFHRLLDYVLPHAQRCGLHKALTDAVHRRLGDAQSFRYVPHAKDNRLFNDMNLVNDVVMALAAPGTSPGSGRQPRPKQFIFQGGQIFYKGGPNHGQPVLYPAGPGMGGSPVSYPPPPPQHQQHMFPGGQPWPGSSVPMPHQQYQQLYQGGAGAFHYGALFQHGMTYYPQPQMTQPIQVPILPLPRPQAQRHQLPLPLPHQHHQHHNHSHQNGGARSHTSLPASPSSSSSSASNQSFSS